GFWSSNIDPSSWTLETFNKVLFEDAITAYAFRNSLTLGFIGATIAVLVSALISVGVNRRKSPLLRVAEGSIRLPATLSNIVIGLGFLLAFGGPPFNLAGSRLLLLLAYVGLYM